MFTRIVVATSLLAFVTPAFAGDNQETLKATVVEQKADAKPEAKADQGAASGASFSSASCTNGKNTRDVVLTSTNAQTKLPCEVHYKKTTEQAGHDQVLWQSANNLSFCESKAQAFVEKLKGWGWSCTAK